MNVFEGLSMLVGTILAMGFVLWSVNRLMAKDDTEVKARPPADPLILAHQAEILGVLATLPQFLSLKNGGVINLVSGETVISTESEREPPYLLLKGPRMKCGILFSTVSSLNKYVAFQRRVAERFGGPALSSAFLAERQHAFRFGKQRARHAATRFAR